MSLTAAEVNDSKARLRRATAMTTTARVGTPYIKISARRRRVDRAIQLLQPISPDGAFGQNVSGSRRSASRAPRSPSILFPRFSLGPFPSWPSEINVRHCRYGISLAAWGLGQTLRATASSRSRKAFDHARPLTKEWAPEDLRVHQKVSVNMLRQVQPPVR